MNDATTAGVDGQRILNFSHGDPSRVIPSGSVSRASRTIARSQLLPGRGGLGEMDWSAQSFNRLLARSSCAHFSQEAVALAARRLLAFR